MLPKLSVKKPYTVGVGVVIVLILGFVSFMNMTTDLLPSIDLPYMIVSTAYPGASPEKVESAVTKLLEQELATTTGLENMSSISSENVSMVMLGFNQTINMDSAMIDVNGKIDKVKGTFEEGIASPIIIKMNPDMIPIMMLSVDLEGMSIKEVSDYVSRELLPEFERIEGVASVSPTGLVEEQLTIQLDNSKIEGLNNKIIASIDSELGAQVDELNKAKNELANMKSTLESEKEKQVTQLETAKVELQKGKEQLQAAVDAIGLSREELQQAIDLANSAYAQNTARIAMLQEALGGLQEDDPEYLFIESQIKILEEQGTQIQEGLNVAQQGMGAMEQLAALEDKEKELSAGMEVLEKEFDKGYNQLVQSEGQLSTATSQLEAAKEVAYEKANIQDQITIEMLANILKAQNFAMPAGYVEEVGISYLVKVGDKFESVESLENLLLFNMEGIGEVRVKDIATVSITDNASEMYTNINGNPGVILTFQKASAYSTASVTQDIREKIEALSVQNPEMQITTLSDQGVYIDIIIDSVLDNLIYGGILAVIILILFLRSFKTTLVVAFSIPISVLFAIVLMYFSGVTLNIISLSGLALGVGMLVDNSIVVIENIYRLRSEGVSKREAAVVGAQQVSGAIFASTLTTICVFLPIVFTSGMTRELFVDMGLTIAYSLVASLIVAVTLVPAMSATLLTNVQEKQGKVFTGFVGGYEKLLRKSLKYKWIVIVFAVGLLGFCGYKATTMGTSFMPAMDTTQMTVTLSVDKETTKSELYTISNGLIDRLLTIEDVATVGALESGTMSMGGPMSGNDMMFYIILEEDKKLSNVQVEEEIYRLTKDIQGEIQVASSTMDMSALSGDGIQLTVKGVEIDQLTEIAKGLGELLEDVEGTMDVSNGLEEASIETRIVVDKNKAMTYGLTVAQVYQTVSGAIKEEEKSTPVRIENQEYPVIVSRTSTVTRDGLMDYVFNAKKDGEDVEIKIGDIASLETADSLTSIRRDNQSRYITVTAGIDTNHNIGLVSREVEEKLESFQVPEGYTVELEGESQMIKEATKDLVNMLILAILFVYLIMVAQFQSLLSPFIVMFTIPLAFTGGLLALLITGTEISVISILGFLVLTGVVVNNGIVFVDYVNQLREGGSDKKDALIEAGRTRIRPILMTALTTILAMSTMAVGVGMGAEMTQGLAIVTIGGLLYGTALTLIVIPVLYDLFHPNKKVKQ